MEEAGPSVSDKLDQPVEVHRSLQSRTKHSGTLADNKSGTLHSRAKHLGSLQNNNFGQREYMAKEDPERKSSSVTSCRRCLNLALRSRARVENLVVLI
ncbi:hypothetical protein Tco_0913467 [Tanacetum coccineum]